MKVFENLALWMDPVRRTGPEAMAVDEYLLDTVTYPVLRVYSWKGDWASIGYFGSISEARLLFPTLGLVRRWTGGGMVDHRDDWTYSLVVPVGEDLVKARGAESYRRIHEKLLQTIAGEGIEMRMSGSELATASNRCFENPVSFDLVDSQDRKLAGAGQRRSKSGLLHQGSVSLGGISDGQSARRAETFAALLARRCFEFSGTVDAAEVGKRAFERYSSDAWMNRR